MSILSLPERKMLLALNLEQTTNFKGKQLMEWSTSKIESHEGEKVFFVKKYGVYVAIKT